MRNLFIFLAVGCLAVLGFSCSDDGGDRPRNKKIVLKAVPTVVKVNEPVDFLVSFGEKNLDGADLYINQEKISNPYTFDSAGVFEVVAKKKGFKDSDVVEIKVNEEFLDEEILLLVSSHSHKDVIVEDDINFNFIFNEEIINDADLFLNGSKIPGHSYKVPEEDSGMTLLFVAKKDGIESNEVVLRVKEILNQDVDNYIEYEGIKYETETLAFVFSETVTLGTDVYDVWNIFAIKSGDKGVVNRLVFVAAFKRGNPAEKTYPVDGVVTVAAWVSTQFVLDSKVLPTKATNSANFVISNFVVKTDDEGSVYSDENTNIKYEFVLEDKKIVKGVHTGIALIFPDGLPESRSEKSLSPSMESNTYNAPFKVFSKK